jgi:hypothetical protein
MKFKFDDVNYSIYKNNSVSILRYGVFSHGDFIRYVRIHKTENTILNDCLYNNSYIAEGEYLFVDKPDNSIFIIAYGNDF